MANGTISSTFAITLIGDLTAANAANTFVTSRALTVVACEAFNLGIGASTLRITTGGGTDLTTTGGGAAGIGIVQAQAVIGPAAPVPIFPTNGSVASGTTLICLAGSANVIKVVLTCIGNPSQSLGTLT